MLYAARVSVWLRWVALAVVVAQLAYRPEFWVDSQRGYLVLLVPLLVFNGLVHYRLRRGWMVTWRWLLFLHAVDVSLITGALAMAGDFDIYTFVAYYVALALFAVVFTSLWLCMAWTTMVALVYSLVSVGVQPGLDIASGEEKALLGRVAAMYGSRSLREPDRQIRAGLGGGSSARTGAETASRVASSSPRPSTTPPRRRRTWSRWGYTGP